ncbi:Rv2175c family DNA-binding protein [Micromonospora sp. KLBMP9576]|uniref:Rv2175c family DNA-binding protein n=1 Tax=Micromonospora sp. KLBMP9576 TaxID=3424769 RepID=UPI003D8A7409
MTDSVPADRAVPGAELAGPADAADWLTLPDVAERLDVSISKVHQMIRDGELIAVRRDGIRRMPADLVANETVLKHLPGVLNLLTDAGYDDEAALRWLYEPDDSLPGACAAKALGGDQAREVKRRAQALGF